MNYLLDTNIIIDAINRRRGRDLFINDVLPRNDSLACCAINLIEVYSGLRPHESERTRKFFDRLECYPITHSIGIQAGMIRNDYQRRGITLSLPDATIAAVALAHDLTLVTDNVKDFPMPELRLYPLPE